MLSVIRLMTREERERLKAENRIFVRWILNLSFIKVPSRPDKDLPCRPGSVCKAGYNNNDVFQSMREDGE